MSTSEFNLAYPIPPGMRKLWWVPLIAGIIWTMISLVIFRFDASSVRAVGIVVGIVFIAWALEEFALMMSFAGSDELAMRTPWRWLHGVLGLLLLAGGIVALANPVDTFLSIAALVGWILLFKGLFDIILALANRDADLWWTRLVLGILELFLAVIVSGSLQDKAIFLIIFVAAGTLLRGIGDIIFAFQLRRSG
jgi:uncharacterized membrane protein HdeD (DUF308 family)